MHPKNFTFDNKEYLAWVRKNPCLICLTPLVDAHHVKHSRKNDFYTVPLCRQQHSQYHSLGHDSFEDKFAICLDSEIINLLSTFIDGKGEKIYVRGRTNDNGLF